MHQPVDIDLIAKLLFTCTFIGGMLVGSVITLIMTAVSNKR